MNTLHTTAGSLPDWFTSSIEAPCQPGETTVDGCKINFLTWGKKGKPGLVLLHGSNAHLEWWRVIAPMLSDDFRVVAMDSSGSGNSGWRAQYSGEMFAREVMAVAKAAGLGDKPYVAGHSFGGFATLEAGHLHGAELGGVILVDFAVQSEAMRAEFLEMRADRLKAPPRPTRVYPDKAAALARFRLVPTQPCKHDFLIDYIAGQSVREVDGGWTWKFDPLMFRNLNMEGSSTLSQTDKLLNLQCHAAFIMAAESMDYTVQAAEYTRELCQGKIPVFDVPGTYHHLMFDEPVAVAMAMKATLLAWDCG